MKMTSLLAMQQKYLPKKEREFQKVTKIVPFIPLVLAVIMLLPAIGNPEILPSSVVTTTFLLLLTPILASVVNLSKRKFLKRLTAEQLERIDSECLSAPQFGGFMVTNEALLYFMPAIVALPLQEIVWVYPVSVTHRKGILIAKTYYAIAVVTKDKKVYTLLRENMDPAQMNQTIIFLKEHLTKLREHLIVGYSEELHTVFKKQFDRMVQMAEQGTGQDIDLSVYGCDYSGHHFAPKDNLFWGSM